MPKPRSRVALLMMPMVFGLIGLTTLSQRPRFDAFHTVDVLQLLASGMCFGVTLTTLLLWRRFHD